MRCSEKESDILSRKTKRKKSDENVGNKNTPTHRGVVVRTQGARVTSLV